MKLKKVFFLGQRFAMIELKVTIANVLRKLKLEAVVPEHRLKIATDVILKPLNGAPVNVKVR